MKFFHHPSWLWRGTGRFDGARGPAGPPKPAPARTQGLAPADFADMPVPDRFSGGGPKNDVVKGTRVNHVARDSVFARHGGGLKGIESHPGYFKRLGVTAIRRTPLVANDVPRASCHGCAVTDCHQVGPRYGANAGHVQFVKNAHTEGHKRQHGADF